MSPSVRPLRTRRPFRWPALAGMGVAFSAVVMPAQAQLSEMIPGTMAMTPEASQAAQQPLGSYDPLGVRWGSFMAYANAGGETVYNDNIFATESGQKGDMIAIFRPAVTLRSDWTNHAVNVFAGGDFKGYARNGAENVANGSVAANGRLDIMRNIYLMAGAGYQATHEDRTSPDSVAGQNAPTRYRVASGRMAFVHDRGRIALRLDGGVDRYRYSDGVTDSGVVIRQSDRDRTELTLVPRVSYRVTDRYSAFVQAPISRRNYRQPSAGAGPGRDINARGLERDSEGLEIDAGARLDISGTIAGEVFIGRIRQRYDGPPVDTSSDLGFGGNLYWSPTTLTSVRGSLSRSIQETTLTPATGFLQTTLGGGVDHLLRDNVVVTASAGLTAQNYRGFARRDRVYDAGVGARYLLNRYAVAGLSASYKHRTSSFAGAGYRQVTVSASFTIQY